MTAEPVADELERHLLGTEGQWDWDDATSIRIADPRLEAVRSRLGENLDSLSTDEDKDELGAIFAAFEAARPPSKNPSDLPFLSKIEIK